MALTFLTTAAFLLFVLAGRGRLFAADPNSGSLKLPQAVLMYACIGAAVLAKGPVGMLLPLAALGFYVLVVAVDRPMVPLSLLYAIILGSMVGECAGILAGRWAAPLRLAGIMLPAAALAGYLLAANGSRNVVRAVWRMRPLTAIVVIAAVAVPWYVLVGVRTDGRWLREFIVNFNLRPFQQPIQGHGDASSLDQAAAALAAIAFYFFHIAGLLFGFFPWAVLLGPTIADAMRRLHRRDAWWNGGLLAVCWFSAWFVFWSLCKTKLPHYLLPAYPALALMTACFIDRWLTVPASVAPWSLRNGWISMILVGAGVMIAVPIVAWTLLPGEEVLGLVGLILVVGGGWCWWETARRRPQRAAIGLAVTSAVFLTVVFAFAVLRVNRHQNGPAMIARIQADSAAAPRPPSPPIASFAKARFTTRAIPSPPATTTRPPAVPPVRNFASFSPDRTART